jgi:ribosomal protein L37AE/L43A
MTEHECEMCGNRASAPIDAEDDIWLCHACLDEIASQQEQKRAARKQTIRSH